MKFDPHQHDLPRASWWRSRGRVYACVCGDLFVCRKTCGGGGDCVWLWKKLS